MALTPKLGFAIMASALGSAFQHGYNTGVMNNPQQVLMDWLNQTTTDRKMSLNKQQSELIWSVITAIFGLGGALGALFVGYVSHFFGLKWGLIFNNILLFLSAFLIFLSKICGLYELLIVARFMLGINAGIFAGICPMYLNEISPVANRGAIGSIYQLIITISILVAQVLGFKGALGGANTWPYLLGGVILIPAIIQCIMLPFCPESPRFLLIIKQNEAKASDALKWLRNTENNSEEINEMKSEAAAQAAAGVVTWNAMFSKKSLRTPLIIALMIMLAQQLCGINAIMVYSNDIFRNAGLDDNWSTIGTIIMGIVNVIMTVVSLILVDLLGRKTLLIIGFSGTTVSMTLTAICIKFSETYTIMGVLCVIFVIAFVIFFATGPGSVPWFLVTELFKQDARPRATSLAVFTNWFANTMVMLAFLPIKHYLGYFVFLIFIVCQIIFLIFIFFKVPETKNKPIEEITAKFTD